MCNIGDKIGSFFMGFDFIWVGLLVLVTRYYNESQNLITYNA